MLGGGAFCSSRVGVTKNLLKQTIFIDFPFE